MIAEIAEHIQINVTSGEFHTVVGSSIRIKGRALVGNDGKLPIIVSHPWMYGSFPIRSSQKFKTVELKVKAPSLSFDYKGTNANLAVFEFSPSTVR